MMKQSHLWKTRYNKPRFVKRPRDARATTINPKTTIKIGIIKIIPTITAPLSLSGITRKYSKYKLANQYILNAIVRAVNNLDLSLNQQNNGTHINDNK